MALGLLPTVVGGLAMGGGGGKGGSSGGSTYSPPASSGKMEALAEELFNEMKPLRTTMEDQGLQALQSGGVGMNIPLVQRALESSNAALSDTLKQLGDNFSTAGLAGTPFAEAIKSDTLLKGKQAGNQAATGASTWFLNNIIPFLQGNKTTGEGLLSGANATNAQGSIAAMQANQQANSAKGNQMATIFSSMMPNVSFTKAI